MIITTVMKTSLSLILINVILISSIQTNASNQTDWAVEIDGNSIVEDITELSSDSYEGRFPGSKGDVLSQNYITNKLTSYNIQPLIGDSYFQNFTLSEWSQPVQVNVTINNHVLTYLTDYVEATLTGESSITSPTDIVFCGYGIDSETYNDYSSIDVNGKI